MRNYDELKEILNSYSRANRGCLSYVFCCFGGNNNNRNLHPDERAFIDGINHVADKIFHGERVYSQNFLYVNQQKASLGEGLLDNERAPLNSAFSNDTSSRGTSDTGAELQSIEIPVQLEQKEKLFEIYLFAVNDYLKKLPQARTDGFIVELQEKLKSKFDNKSVDILSSAKIIGSTNPYVPQVIQFFQFAIQNHIPLKTPAQRKADLEQRRIDNSNQQQASGRGQYGAVAIPTSGTPGQRSVLGTTAGSARTDMVQGSWADEEVNIATRKTNP